MRVSVIVPVYHHWDMAAKCLAALQAQTYPATDFEIILVNNDPGDAPPADFTLPANARLIDEAGKGSYAARNAGLAVARGEILCFTDADCAPVPGWIDAAVACLDAQPGVARVGGPVPLSFQSDRLTMCETYEKVYSFKQRRNIEDNQWSVTANMSTQAKAFEIAGPFDGSRFSGGDKEWGQRAQAAGVPAVYCAEMAVYHPARATWRDLITKQRRLTGGKVIEKMKKRGRGRMRLSFLVGLPFRVLPFSSAVKRIFTNTEFPLGDRIKAFGVYYVLRLSRVYETGRLLFSKGAPERR